jgi:hypothetical protein
VEPYSFFGIEQITYVHSTLIADRRPHPSYWPGNTDRIVTVSTTIILRLLPDVARTEGVSINSIDTRMACFVFALGGKKESDYSAECFGL